MKQLPFPFTRTHEAAHTADVVVADENGNTHFIEGKFGSGKSYVMTRHAVERWMAEGETERQLIRYRFWAVDAAIEQPPKAAEFLLLLVPLKYRENLLGDAIEEYWTRLVPRHGARKAKFTFGRR
jgi:hypothetical protein